MYSVGASCSSLVSLEFPFSAKSNNIFYLHTSRWNNNVYIQYTCMQKYYKSKSNNLLGGTYIICNVLYIFHLVTKKFKKIVTNTILVLSIRDTGTKIKQVSYVQGSTKKLTFMIGCRPINTYYDTGIQRRKRPSGNQGRTVMTFLQKIKAN